MRRREGTATRQLWEPEPEPEDGATPVEPEPEPEPSELTQAELLVALEEKRAQQAQITAELQTLEARLQPSEGVPPG